MAQTVAQHSVATFTTPVNGTSPIDATTVRGNDNTLRVGYNDHDADPGVHLQSSLLASRPAAGESGRKWLTTDVAALKVFFDTGSAWSEISYLPLSGGTVAGNVSITGTLGVTGVLTATGGVVGNVTGNADTATKLSSARTFAVTGDVTGSVSSDLTSGASIGTTLGTGVVSNTNVSASAAIAYSKLALSASIVNADISATAAIVDTKLDTISTASKVSNSATTATSANTASAIVARDGSGNFTAGTITAALTGNASTATALATARTINGTSFDGTANITVTAAAGTLTGATLASNVLASSLTSVGTLATLAVTGTATLNTVPYTFPASQGSASTVLTNDGSGTLTWAAPASGPAAAGTLTGATLASNVLASSLTSVGTLSSLAVSGTTALNAVTYTWPAADGTNTYVLSTNGSGTLSWAASGSGTTTNSLTAGTYLTGSPFNGSAAITFAVDATSANTASKVVARDASGNFSAGTVTAALTGNASTATALATARAINGTNFDGTAAITVTAAAGTLTGATLASNVLASSLTSVGTLTSLGVTGTVTGGSFTGAGTGLTGTASSLTAGGNAVLGANTFTAAQEWATGTAIASAATVNLNTATGNRVHITGTTAITAVTLTRGPRTVIFDGILTLTHNATTNNLPGAANITTAANDRAVYESDGTTVYCRSYTKASGLPVVSAAAGFTLGTPVASTSGTSISFTGIPATARQIVVHFKGVGIDASGTDLLIQLGDSGGIETSGYVAAGASFNSGSTNNVQASSTGFLCKLSEISQELTGCMTFNLENSSTNSWSGVGGFARTTGNLNYLAAGGKSLSATLDRISITTTSGTANFDLGEINIAYI